MPGGLHGLRRRLELPQGLVDELVLHAATGEEVAGGFVLAILRLQLLQVGLRLLRFGEHFPDLDLRFWVVQSGAEALHLGAHGVDGPGVLEDVGVRALGDPEAGDGDLRPEPLGVRDLGVQLWNVDEGAEDRLVPEGARHQRSGKPLPHDHIALHLPVNRLACVLRQRGLRVERIHLAPAAAHEQRDHGRRARLEMRRLGRVRVAAHRRGRTCVG